MIRAVLDANVLVAGFVTAAGIPGLVTDRRRRGAFEFVVAEHIVTEVSRAWHDPYYLIPNPRERLSFIPSGLPSPAHRERGRG